MAQDSFRRYILGIAVDRITSCPHCLDSLRGLLNSLDLCGASLSEVARFAEHWQSAREMREWFLQLDGMNQLNGCPCLVWTIHPEAGRVRSQCMGGPKPPAPDAPLGRSRCDIRLPSMVQVRTELDLCDREAQDRTLRFPQGTGQ